MRYLIPLLVISSSALAEEAPNMSRCADAQKIHDFLVTEYGEKPFAEMKTVDGNQLIMYVNPKTSTYTVVATDYKISCGISAGKDFKPATEKHFEEPKTGSGKPENPS